MLSVLAGLEEEILIRNHDDMNENVKARKLPVRIVILDSIAAPMRRDFGANSAAQRSAAVFKCAQILKRLAHELQVAVIVINQVGLGNLDVKNIETFDDKVSIKAALGISWHHCVSTRILLEHDRDPHRIDPNHFSDHLIDNRLILKNKRGRVRTATIVKSNIAGHTNTQFELTTMGLTGLSC